MGQGENSTLRNLKQVELVRLIAVLITGWKKTLTRCMHKGKRGVRCCIGEHCKR